MIISLSGPGYSYSELAAFAEKLKDRLIDIDGITRIEVVGEQGKRGLYWIGHPETKHAAAVP